MTPVRFKAITGQYARLRVAVVGDFTLDRYLEIDPALRENSIETGLPVYNVSNVRSLPGCAGTILNNLCALGVGTIYPVGFCGMDGEGFELLRALDRCPGVVRDHFLQTEARRTFTYCKPLMRYPDAAPQELNRLDTKNWSPTPSAVEDLLIRSIRSLALQVDAIILMDQVEVPETGVITTRVRETIRSVRREYPKLLISADSRRGLRGFPPVIFKMNAHELSVLTGAPAHLDLAEIQQSALTLARANQQRVFITLAERGMIGVTPDGEMKHVPAWPLRGDIDVVGAGDAVTANLMCALAAGAELSETLELASAAASIVIHQVGTTGTATVSQLQELLCHPAAVAD
jgi:ADP-heptose synthase, bifunctional sugar kinase/adenylyltransferase